MVLSSRSPLAPSCFGGVEGDRTGCLVTIPQELADYVLGLEDCVKDLIAATISNIADIWVSSIRTNDNFPPSLRCKINTLKVTYFNEETEPCKEPTDWHQLSVNVCVAMRGAYIQKSCAGLLIDVSHLQYSQSTTSPF